MGVDDLRAAGVSRGALRVKEGTAAQCLTMEERPPTPPEIRKWRRSQIQAGERVLHPGLREDVKKLDPKAIYGDCKAVQSDHVADVWRQDTTGLGKLKQDMAERLYHSVKNEPLGRTCKRGHTLPAQTSEKTFKFGVSSDKSEGVKTLLYPAPVAHNPEAEELYKRSHFSYGPGEQVKRGYDWKRSSPDGVFGRPGGPKQCNGVSFDVAAVLQLKTDDPPPRISSLKLEEFRSLQNVLGRARNLAQDGPARANMENHTYGKASRRRAEGEWDARHCVEGEYSWEEQQPDADLGKSTMPGFRSISVEDRAYGVPTVRNDIPALPIHKRSVADSQNYGDGITSWQLINPGNFNSQGVEDSEFFEPRPKDEVRTLFDAVGYAYDTDVFDHIFYEASNDKEFASLAQFQAAANVYEEACARGREQDWRADRGLL